MEDTAKIIKMITKDKFGLSLVKQPTRALRCEFEYEMITVDVTGTENSLTIVEPDKSVVQPVNADGLAG